MASAQRIQDLKIFCVQWQESSENLVARRDELLSWQSAGITIFENDGSQNLLPIMIEETDAAAKSVHAIFIRMQALYARAVAGEDV